ncbi:SMI1/KNR4 family protein [Paenibacillus sp. 481]|uniref:SMI1/KNR4 family protein n=1 Tax=Paenibacillus sp. 481 TaxID=2835869 RepID=UPI001E382B84|nr:SMI1/KNR4 family protein [Paenibacillus sp. 481]UHA72060.1 SMI1/KNR4 family protein [Paenibacillus sp. 481]
MFVQQVLKSLSELYSQGSRKINADNGYLIDSVIKLTNPASSESISWLTERYPSWPEDYLNFLSITNGCRLFEDVVYSGENEIFSAEEVLETNSHYNHPSKIIVAYICGDHIFIDSEDVKNSGGQYMYVSEGGVDFDDARSLYCDFQTWLDRFVMAQGNKYWTWRVEDRKF